MKPRIIKDDRSFWWRGSYLGRDISNGNWIIAVVLLAASGGAFSRQWIIAGVVLLVAGLLSFVWNEGVAKTTAIITAWVSIGAGSAWVLGLACGAMFGMPVVGYAVGLIIGIAGVVTTID